MATTEFRDAAAHQSRALGFEAAIVWVPHPIQTLTAGELQSLAKACVSGILGSIRRRAI